MALTIKSLKEKIKTVTGYDSIVSRKSPVVLIVSTSKDDDREDILKNVIAPTVDGKFVMGTSIHGPIKSSVGGVTVGRYTILTKEEITTQTVTAMTANTFVSKADKETRTIDEDEIDFYVFSDYKVLESSIIEGCKDKDVLGQNMADIFAGFFKTGSFEWGEVTPPSLTSTIGVYVGELLSGWVFLKGSQTNHISGTPPFRTKATKFYLPTDSRFGGVDSYMGVGDDLYGISNKSDQGHPASFFTNILPAAVKSFKLRQAKNTLKDLITICSNKGINPTKAKEIVYAWGVNKHLGFSRMVRPHSIIDAIVHNKFTENHYKILSAVETRLRLDNDTARLKVFPFSLSSYFNNQLAIALQEDSTPSIIRLVTAKQFYQLNLNKQKFLEGKLEFKSTKAGKTSITISGSASAQDNISSRNGWINYKINRTK